MENLIQFYDIDTPASLFLYCGGDSCEPMVRGENIHANAHPFNSNSHKNFQQIAFRVRFNLNFS